MTVPAFCLLPATCKMKAWSLHGHRSKCLNRLKLTGSAALKLFNEGWKMWSMGKEQKSTPPLPLDIKNPALGKKVVPRGQSPITYLRGQRALQDYSIDDAKVSYWCPNRHVDITVSSSDNWKAYFEMVASGHAPELVVYLPWSLKMAAGSVVAQLSGKHREMFKEISSPPRMQKTKKLTSV